MYAGTMCLHACLFCTYQSCDDVLLYGSCEAILLSCQMVLMRADCQDLHDDCMSKAHISLHRLRSGLHTLIAAFALPMTISKQHPSPHTNSILQSMQHTMAPCSMMDLFKPNFRSRVCKCQSGQATV